MSTETKKKTLGQAIDEVVNALEGLDEDTVRVTAIRAACEHLGLSLGNVGDRRRKDENGNRQEGKESGGGEDGGRPGTAVDIRSLKSEKSPASAVEMACIVAYYLQSLAPAAERKTEIDSGDIETYFRHAEYPLPKYKSQVLVNAKIAGYFDSAGRGTYRLNAVGHNLVVHSLPRASGQSPPPALRARKKRTPARQRSAKKGGARSSRR